MGDSFSMFIPDISIIEYYVIFCRPLEVNLNFPQSYNKTLEQVVDRMNNGMPTEKDLLNLHYRTKRILNLIENILIQHEKLTLEAIRTLRTIRLVTKWTASFIFISLLYFYIRKFHSQSPIYQFISERRNLVAFILAGVGVTVYCYTHKELFLRTIAAIS